MIRVMIVDDHAMLRQGLITMLAVNDDFEMVGEASDGEMAVMMYEHNNPDVVLMDVLMPRMDGVTATQKIRANHPDAKILMLTSFVEDDKIKNALNAGAIGYLLKDVSADDLAKAVRAAAKGKRSLAPEAADALLRILNPTPKMGHDLTEREREVLSYMSEGLNNAEIAAKLFLGVSTVKFHVSSILSKLGVTNRVEAVALALNNNLIETKT